MGMRALPPTAAYIALWCDFCPFRGALFAAGAWPAGWGFVLRGGERLTACAHCLSVNPGRRA